MNSGLARILCVEPNPRLLESRSAVLRDSGYCVKTAPPQQAEAVLRNEWFDLLIVRSLDESALYRLAAVSGAAEVLILEGFTKPSELLSLVAEQLKYGSDTQTEAGPIR